MKTYRTLVRVDFVAQSGHLLVTVPAWNPDVRIFVPFDSVPQSILDTITEVPVRLWARVNLGAEDVSEVQFTDWEAP